MRHAAGQTCRVVLAPRRATELFSRYRGVAVLRGHKCYVIDVIGNLADALLNFGPLQPLVSEPMAVRWAKADYLRHDNREQRR